MGDQCKFVQETLGGGGGNPGCWQRPDSRLAACAAAARSLPSKCPDRSIGSQTH
jgi:hypothetical protein